VTAAVILISFLASMILYRFTSWDGYLFGMSFYVLTALSGLLCASVFAALSRDRRCIAGVGVLWLNFIASHVLWNAGDNHYVGAQVLDFLTAAYFVIVGTTRWEWTVGGIYIASVGAGFAGMMGWLPPLTGGFISLTFPYLSAFLGELASAILGLGAGDSGRRVRLAFRARPRWVPERGMALRRY
jgi:hypothetical protein